MVLDTLANKGKVWDIKQKESLTNSKIDFLLASHRYNIETFPLNENKTKGILILIIKIQELPS